MSSLPNIVPSETTIPSPLTIGTNLLLSAVGLTAPRTFTFPDLTDTVATLTAVQTLTNTTLSAATLTGTSSLTGPLIFTAASSPGAGVAGIGADANAGNLILNAPTGKSILLKNNNATILTIGASITAGAGLGMSGSSIFNIFSLTMGSNSSDATAASLVGSRTAALALIASADGATARTIIIQTQSAVTAGVGNAISRMTFSAGAAAGSSGIISSEFLYFNANTTGFAYAAQAGVGADASAGNLLLNAPTAKSVLGQINGTTVLTIAGTLITLAQPASLTGKITTYNNISTQGQGLSTVYKFTLQKSESAADANLLTYTPPATAGSYRIHVWASCSAASVATGFGFTLAWTDSNGSAKSAIAIPIWDNTTGTLAATQTLVAGAEATGFFNIDIDNSAANIVIAVVFGGTSFTAKCSASVEQIG